MEKESRERGPTAEKPPDRTPLRLEDRLWVLMVVPSVEFFQLIETGSTLSDVAQCESGMNGLRYGR